jgi:hypothetical protein
MFALVERGLSGRQSHKVMLLVTCELMDWAVWLLGHFLM